MEDKIKRVYNLLLKEYNQPAPPILKPIEELSFNGRKTGLAYCLQLLEKQIPALKGSM